MSQPFADKCEAIASLLGFVWYHLDFIDGAMRVQRYGDSETGGEGRPPAEPYYVGCNGRCYTCIAYHQTQGRKPACPPDEKWLRERATLRRRYRIADLEKSLVSMAQVEPNQAQAVWAVYVEPWPDAKTEPIGEAQREARDRLAWDGVEWMANDIRGDVVGYGEKPDPVENQIRQMASQGYTWKRICRELRCSRRDVSKALALNESAVGG